MKLQHCRGKNVSDGMPCRRNQKLSPAGFCYQHLKQDPAYIEPEKLPTTPGPTQLLQPQQQDNERRRSIGSPSIGGGSGQNSNNDEVVMERSHTDVSSSSSAFAGASAGSGSSVAADAPVTTKGDLPRCTAIAKTTGQQCCKRVSLSGETKCPKHGGKQIKLVSTLPMCGAISKSTRQPCQNHVSLAGQKYCSFHGGATFRATAAVAPQQPATFTPSIKQQQPLREEYENPRGWAEIQTQCMRYLMDTHPKSQCQCATTAEPCQGMRIVMWAQTMVQFAQDHSSSGSSIFDAKASDLVKFIPSTQPGNNDNTKNNLFSDLYQAVSIFGSNIFFLPRFYQHIQHEASGEPPFVPYLLRPTSTAVRMQMDDRESSGGGMMEEGDDDDEHEEVANDNGARNQEIF